MNATAPAPTDVTSTGDVAHVTRWRGGAAEWLAAFESAIPVVAYCGARQAPRLNANDLPLCPECRRHMDGPPEHAPLW